MIIRSREKSSSGKFLIALAFVSALAAVLSLLCFPGCSVLPGEAPSEGPESSAVTSVTTAPDTSASGTQAPSATPDNASGTASALPATDTATEPATGPATDSATAPATEPATGAVTEPATPELTPGPTPLFPVNEYNISSPGDAAASYIGLIAEPEKEILTADGIRAANRKMLENCSALSDILNLPAEIDGKTLKTLTGNVSFAAENVYDRDGNIIDADRIAEIRANAGIIDENDTYPAIPGIIVRRSNLKRLPTDLEFHSFAGSALDLIQDTELYLGMLVRVLLGSEDGRFLFVQTYYYSGWTGADNVAFPAGYEEWLRFAAPDEFIVVTDAKLDIAGEQADMGVILPYKGIDADGAYYTAERPVRNADGTLGAETVTVSVNSAHKGYLKYTYANFLAQAFKYEGTPYSWGGLNGGIDCSSYIASVMRAFGFYLPRDTKDQNYSAGESVDISGLSAEDIRLAIVSSGMQAPLAIYTKGHVRFFIGVSDGKIMTIHAPGSNKLVTAEPFDKFESIVSVRAFYG